MALLQSNKIKAELTNKDLVLEATASKSYLVKDIFIVNPTSAHINIYVGTTLRGNFRVSGALGNHLPFMQGEAKHAHDLSMGATAVGDQTSFASLANAEGAEIAAKVLGGLSASTTYKRAMDFNDAAIFGFKGLIGLMREKVGFAGYPVPKGEKLTISGAASATSVQLVVYDEYEADDIKADMPNGQQSKELTFVNYGNTGATIAAAGDNAFDTQVNPAQFIQFPFGADVPADTEITVYGVLASDFAPLECDGTDGIGTKFLRLSRDEDVLLDDDRNGLLMYAKDYGSALVGDYVGKGYSVLGNYSDVDFRMPFFFDPALTFTIGEELLIELTTVIKGAGKNILVTDQEIGVIMKAVRK
jgi:hypothetical protein